jgi:hypothetical protein
MPTSRKDFERNMHLLSEQMLLGRVHLTMKSIRSLKGVSHAKYAPNKRVNLHTVNEMARLMANTVADMVINKHENKKQDE